MHACTIIARNYLAQARVLAESFLDHHPAGDFSVLVIDDERAPLSPERESFEILRPSDIGLRRTEFDRMATLYDVLELSTALKPWLLRSLLTREAEVLYLDPDVQVFAPLDDVPRLAKEHSIVLTPHTTVPLPKSRNDVPETTILVAGMFNLGFIAVGRRAADFLDWWSDRMRRECIVAPERGRFVDQRWVDFVPCLFDHYIVRDPGYNAAWWNLTTRNLVWTGEIYLVDGEPLHFFHFSGYTPNKPHLLSAHQGPCPNILLTERPELGRICDEYGRRLLEAGFKCCSSEAYGYDSSPSGFPLDGRMRKLYRTALLESERVGKPEPPNPFEQGGEPAFLDWLQEPGDRIGAASKISRYLTLVHTERPDIAGRFPNLRWGDADGYLDWVREVGRYEERIPFELVPEPAALQPKERSRIDPRELRAGINVAAYFRAEIGVGEAARHLVAGVKQAGIPYTTITYTAAPGRQGYAFEESAGVSPNHDVNLICVNADQVARFIHDVGPDFLAHRYSIGLWWWEVAHFPEKLHNAFDVVNEVWAGSDFAARAISAETEKPVLTVPFGLDIPAVEKVSRAELGLPEEFLFLFSFDFFSVVERKNPLGVIDAFKRAFPYPDGPTLVIKSINGDKNLTELERLRTAVDRPDIMILDEYLSSGEKNQLMAACDCYVSLHRSEGLGLTMAEAMAFGRPVIATGYSGNLEFMTPENSYLVPYRLTKIPNRCDPYPAGTEWAEPDVEAAARLMRYVYDNPNEAEARGRRAREDIHDHHSPQQTASFITDRIATIRRTTVLATTRDVAALAESAPRPRKALERAERYITDGPENRLSAPSKLRAVGRLYRRLLFRLLRPYVVRQREFELAVVEAIGDVQREVAKDIETTAERHSYELHGADRRLSDGVQRQIERLSRLETRSDDLSRGLEELRASVTENTAAPSTPVSRLRAPHDVSEPALLGTTDASDGEAIGYNGRKKARQ